MENFFQSQLERYLLKLWEIENSLIIVSEYLQRERIEEVYREVIREFFRNEKRGIYKRRLEEMAYFYGLLNARKKPGSL